MSHFTLLNTDPPSWNVDERGLKRQFLQFQQKCHPDLFSGQGEKESWAKEWSGRLNEAWKTLADDRSRGEYILSLSGVEIGEAEAATDPDLLMQVMEVREALEEASTEEEVAAIRQDNRTAIDTVLDDLKQTFSNAAQGQVNETAKLLLIRLKYFQNIDEACKEWSPGKRVEVQH